MFHRVMASQTSMAGARTAGPFGTFEGLGPYREARVAQQTADEEAARTVLAPYIEPGERFVWLGRPRRGIVFSETDVILIPLSLLWGGFMVVWEVAVLLHASFLLAFAGLPFFALGQFLMWGRFVLDARRRAGLYYAITDQRLLIVGAGGREERMVSFPLVTPRTPQDIVFIEEMRGRGTLRFEALPVMEWPMDGVRAGGGLTPSFEHVRDARCVYERLSAAQRAANDVDQANALAV
jgi:hypothetical protein